jgi:hypothetical protein
MLLQFATRRSCRLLLLFSNLLSAVKIVSNFVVYACLDLVLVLEPSIFKFDRRNKLFYLIEERKYSLIKHFVDCFDQVLLYGM